MRQLTNTLARALERSPNAVTYILGREVSDLFEDFVVLETSSYLFDPLEFADDGQCVLLLDDRCHSQVELVWNSEDEPVSGRPVTAYLQAAWQGKSLQLLRVDLTNPCDSRWLIAAESIHTIHAFFDAVCSWNNEARDDILVFRHGNWTRDKHLAQQISNSKLEDLVAPPGFIEDLLRETAGFFDCEEIYERHGVTWKRGVLLLGPPGNGKTHAIKALIRHMGRPCLYVRNLESERYTLQRSIESVFARARATSPCVLVFEDLDSMVNAQTRSAFLNELDGFASNKGVLVIATANYPEKLDPAILERPSRFDRKVTFDLPGLAERKEFLARSTLKWSQAASIPSKALDSVSQGTEGFSFAYLQELCVSALMDWMRSGGCVSEALDRQVATLRSQMKQDPTPTPVLADTSED
ncbi:MAG: ATP-binding protein [Armatimonadetes bacterium]|nr:ATP-binding protein [Armatimonadota bacterium]